MKDNVLVTVVTITYNLVKTKREKFIRQCIECVKNQTYPFIEHIIIDGASNDGTLEIFKDYPHLKVFSEPDSGIYNAMNKGVKLASGKYVVFLNSDDFWHDSRAVEASVEALEANKADFSYAPCSYLDENNNFVGYLYPTMETFFAWMPFCHQTMFTKTELVNFDESFKSAGDFDFVLKLILSGAKGVYVPLNFTTFRWIGMSSGINDDFGNKGGSLSCKEQVNSAKNVLCSYFHLSPKLIETMYNFERVPASFIKKIIKSVNPSLAADIKNHFLRRFVNNPIILDLKPYPKKIQILFNANDLESNLVEYWIKFIKNKDDCELYLYSDSNKAIPEKYSDLPLYEGRIIDISLFCSPVSPVPLYIEQSGIKILNRPEDILYNMNKGIKNIFIKGSYKIKIGKLTLFEVFVTYGTIDYYLLKKIPVLKIKNIQRSKSVYLFNSIKLAEYKY